AFTQFAGQVHAHNIGCQEVNRLAQHRGFSFDPADAPAYDAQAIDHRRVRISADQTVGIINAVLFPDALREILEINLVTDADPRRDDAKAIEGLHAPFQELITRVVPLELHLHVLAKRV